MTTNRFSTCKLAISGAGLPYIWGGSQPATGFDCSGFIIWLFQIVGLLPIGDWTAQDLYNHFHAANLPDDPQAGPGDLAFYGESTERITHVMLLLSPTQVIGAHGGGKQCHTRENARDIGARVSTMPLKYRRDLVAVVPVTYADEN